MFLGVLSGSTVYVYVPYSVNGFHLGSVFMEDKSDRSHPLEWIKSSVYKINMVNNDDDDDGFLVTEASTTKDNNSYLDF